MCILSMEMGSSQKVMNKLQNTVQKRKESQSIWCFPTRPHSFFHPYVSLLQLTNSLGSCSFRLYISIHIGTLSQCHSLVCHISQNPQPKANSNSSSNPLRYITTKNQFHYFGSIDLFKFITAFILVIKPFHPLGTR